MHRTNTKRPGFRKAILIGLLTLVTVLWGGVVAGHAHFGIDHEHCHVCLLPQVADVAPAALESHLPPHLATALETPVYDYRTPTAAPYHSRAPPT